MIESGLVKKDFPIFSRTVNGKALTYLDSAATSQKSQQVIDAVSHYYSQSNANVHRGVHTLGNEATDIFEKARKDASNFLDAGSTHEIVFVRNTTEALNLVSYSWGLENLKAGDVVVAGVWEHHSNFVPWQRICEKTGATFEVVGLDKNKNFSIDILREHLRPQVKLLAIAHASNVLGTIFPVTEIAREVKKTNPQALVVVDGAQGAPHTPISLKSSDIDFYAFSGHKLLAPMGVGVLCGKVEVMQKMQPFLSGGGMVEEVFKTHTTWADIPARFEAGTPDVSSAAGLSAALAYLNSLGMKSVRAYEEELADKALDVFARLQKEIPALQVVGPQDPKKRTALVSFYIPGIHSHDIAAVLDAEGIEIRAGFHCAMPLHEELSIGPSARASAYVYNSPEDFEALYDGIIKSYRILK